MAKDKCSSRGWGYLAANVPDPRACITDCRWQLLQAIVPSNETLGEACKALSDSRRSSNDQVFRMVYCCDSQICGVDNLEGRGKDPNVNWLINACRNIGYRSVVDPGPPDVTYSCKYVSTDEQDSPCTIQQPKIAAGETAASGASSAPGAFRAEDNIPLGMAESQLTISSTAATQRPQATSTRSLIQDASLAASLDPLEASTESDETGGISTSIKVTIALSTVVGVVAILALILWHLRPRRRSHARAQAYNRSNKYGNSPAVPDSPTPLVSPTDPHANPDGLPLTPPPRLRERKLLRTTANWPLRGGEGLHWAGYLDSSLRSSTATAMEVSPPSRGGTRENGDGQGCPRRVDVLRPLPAVTTGQYVQESMSSAVHSPTTTTSTASTVVAPAGYEDVMAYSPPRTPRQRHMPLQVAGLTSPGPPPNRALPSTPRDEQRSAPSTPTRPGADTLGAAVSTAPQSPAPRSALPRESIDLCKLTDEYARQSHHSWGSWSGRGGGGPGVSSQGKGRDVSSPTLEEGELERLGGSYK